MTDNAENAEIVRTVVTLARSLRMDVVAEGVETREQLARLRELECDYGQGYLFSKPLDAGGALELLRHHDYSAHLNGQEDEARRVLAA